MFCLLASRIYNDQNSGGGEREREGVIEFRGEGSEIHYQILGGGSEIAVAVWKVPRHCPLVLLGTLAILLSLICPYLTGNTLRLLYEPNRLMLFLSL
jgi:hypothetical protein